MLWTTVILELARAHSVRAGERMQGSLVKEMESMLGKPVSIGFIPIVSQLIHLLTI